MLSKYSWPVVAALTVMSAVACGDDDTTGLAEGGAFGKGGSGGKNSGGATQGGKSNLGGTTGNGGTTPGGAGGEGGSSGGAGPQGGAGPSGGASGEGGGIVTDGGMIGEGGAATTTGGVSSGGSSSGGKGGSAQGGQGGAPQGGQGGTNDRGGASGDSGSGGAGGGLACGPGLGLALIASTGQAQNGWIDASTNCIGVQGAVNAVHDTKGSLISFSSTLGHICVSGNAEQVVGNDFANYWGSVLSIQLNNPGDPPATLPYDASAHGIAGFAFRLVPTGPAGVPDLVRVRYRVDGVGAEYCEELCSDGEHTAIFGRSHTQCWLGTSGATPNSSNLTHLELHIPSNASGDVGFDFCVEDLRAVLTPPAPNPPTGCDSGSGGSGGAGGTTGTGGAGGTTGTGATSGAGGASGGLSCWGSCGEFLGECACDLDCGEIGDCCPDYAAACL